MVKNKYGGNRHKKMARKLANMHPIGVLMADQGSRAPMTGEIWSARYLTKDRTGIILKERVGLSPNFSSLSEKDSVYQSAASSWSAENPQLLSSYGGQQGSYNVIPYKPSGSKITAEKLYADLISSTDLKGISILFLFESLNISSGSKLPSI